MFIASLRGIQLSVAASTRCGNCPPYRHQPSGTVVGWAAGELGFEYSFEYDLKKGDYTAIIDDFAVMGISESGMMVGNPAYNLDLCAIRDKHGNITPFYPDSWNETSVCDARGVNPDGKASGFVIADFGYGIWTAFIFDSEYGTYDEFVHLSPCNPDAPPPPPLPGSVGGTDVYLAKIRNDGVVAGQCVDWQYDWVNDVFTVFGAYGLIGTPVK